MAKWSTRLTGGQVSVALKKLETIYPAVYPGEFQFKYRDYIIYDIYFDSDNARRKFPDYFNGVLNRQRTVNSSQLNRCTQEDQCFLLGAKVAVGAVFFAIKLVRLNPPPLNDTIVEVLVRELGRRCLKNLFPAIRKLAGAKNGHYKATCLLDMMEKIYDLGVFNIVLRELVYSISRWDWILIGLRVFIQVAFPVGGFLNLLNLAETCIEGAQVVEDAIKFNRCCNNC